MTVPRDGSSGPTAEDLYRFDLMGYLVLRDVLDKRQLARINQILDGVSATVDGEHVHTGFPPTSKFQNQDPKHPAPVDVPTDELLLWGGPVADLVRHPVVVPFLDVMLGPDARLDHAYAIFMRAGHPYGGTQALHNGGVPFEPAHRYEVRDGAFDLGLVTVSFALTDAPSGSGGFCCVPGSHKSNFEFPDAWRGLERPSDLVSEVALSAGDVLIFTEALTHGTLRWEGADERRALLFKYMPGYAQWSETLPAAPSDLAPEIRAVLRPAFRSGR